MPKAQQKTADFHPVAPEQLAPGPLAIDTETDGLDVFKGARPIGLSFFAFSGAESGYLPWGHAAHGPQLDSALVKRWAQKTLAGRDLYFAHARFDVHMLREWGVDLEALGCRVHDVQFHAALLDEHKRSYSLDNLAKEYLNESKLEMKNKDNISKLSAAEVAPYAIQDAALTAKLAMKFADMLKHDELEEVAKLEDELIYCVCAMEKAGARLDVEKLHSWRRVCQNKYLQNLFSIHRAVGRKINVNSTQSLLQLFQLCKIEHESASVTYEDLERYADQHSAVRLALDARRYTHLLSKYLDKYIAAVEPSGIIRYNLNQLRSDTFGSVSGRFSSTDINIQQVFSEQNQVGVSSEFPIRELFIPEEGKQWISADASQVEFRLFAHYSKDAKVIGAYKRDPKTDFHQTVADLTGLSRYEAKHINFGSLYGMGVEKMIRQIQMSMPNVEAGKIEEMYKSYHKLFPAVKKLSREAMKLADERGFVKTFLGRRRRFAKGEKTHAALNAVIQGTAADLMKLKLRELYEARKDLGLTMRFTVHDEVDGDVPNEPYYRDLLKKFLDMPSLELRVPVLWDVETGQNWRLKND